MASPIFTPDLLDDFARDRVAIFLGAGVSAGVNTRTGKPISTWAEFLDSAAKETLNKSPFSLSPMGSFPEFPKKCLFQA